MNVGVVSTLYPTNRFPTAGIFIKEELMNLSKNVPVKLIAPLNIVHWFGEDHQQTGIEGYPVLRPFIVAVPWWFLQRLYPYSMALSLKRSGKSFFSDCTIVHAHNAFPDSIATVRAFGERMPVIVTVHGSDINYFAMKPHLRPDIVWALNASKRVICVSNSLAKTLKEMGVTSKTVVIPNGIDTAVHFPGDKDYACRLLNLNPQRLRILFAGNFVPVKGIEYLIRAMPVILEKYPACELVLLGARPHSRDLTLYDEAIRKADITHTVRIVQKVPHENLPSWIHASDLLVLPSIKEGFGLVVAEALACGRPVVSTMSGGPEDIVKKGMGVLVPPRDENALAQGILNVLDGDGILCPESLSESARSRYSYESIVHRILKVYNEVVSE